MSIGNLRIRRSFLTVVLLFLVLVTAFACNDGLSDTSTSTVRNEDNDNNIGPAVPPPPAQVVDLNLGTSSYGSAAVDCNPNCSGEPGWTTSLTASPNSGYEFVGWQCSGSCPVGDDNIQADIVFHDSSKHTHNARFSTGTRTDGRSRASNNIQYEFGDNQCGVRWSVR